MPDPTDARLRTAVFNYLDRLLATSPDGSLPSPAINSFTFEGRPIRLVVQSGIWKPAGLDAALTIRTTYTPPNQPPPYADDVEGGVVHYKYRGTNPNHSDNRALRQAMIHELPLVYFVGVARGIYVPRFPVWLVDEDLARHQFAVAVDEGQRHVDLSALPEPQREYVEPDHSSQTAPARLPSQGPPGVPRPLRHVPLASCGAARRRPHHPRRPTEGRSGGAERSLALQDPSRRLRREPPRSATGHEGGGDAPTPSGVRRADAHSWSTEHAWDGASCSQGPNCPPGPGAAENSLRQVQDGQLKRGDRGPGRAARMARRGGPAPQSRRSTIYSLVSGLKGDLWPSNWPSMRENRRKFAGLHGMRSWP